MGLLILLYPFAEIYAFYKFIEAYSFFDAVFFVVLSAFAGGMIIRLLGPSTLMLVQKDFSQGKIPAHKILHRSLVIMGGFLLFVPGIITDILGVLCILPGSRHLIAFYIKRLVRRGIFKGRVFMSGFGRPDGFGTGSKSTHGWEQPPPTERDVQIVDIEPLEISHKNLPPNDDSGNK